jgi:hypothetical protein
MMEHLLVFMRIYHFKDSSITLIGSKVYLEIIFMKKNEDHF